MQTSATLSHHFLPLNSPDATLDLVGGKGLNLAILARAGFSVPDGFFIPTNFYRGFVVSNNLFRQIQRTLNKIDLTSLDELSAASDEIRAQFGISPLPPGLAPSLESAWHWLGGGPVAVRSSATAEDLPGMSFAGQQDTFLNILDQEALLRAVLACWSSLWSARAIGYRERNGISHQEVSLAVVVQNMVQSEASGVMFTANPLTGLRTETVIDATLGLGEALVSGQVEPDHYVVDILQSTITTKTTGSKAVIITANSAGGVLTQKAGSAQVQSLPDEAILKLAQLGKEIEDVFDFPQDIEWAWAKAQLYILQSRPITSLFPLPDGLRKDPLRVFFSFAAVQGMLDPLTPLGLDVIREVFAAGASIFGVLVTRATQSILYEAGERLWINFTPLIRNSLGRRVVPVVFGMVEPSVGQAIEQIWDDPRLRPERPGISFTTRRRLVRFFFPLLVNVILNLIAPQKRREHILANGEKVLKLMESRAEALTGSRWQRLAGQADLLPKFAREYFPSTFLLFVSGVAAGMASWNFLTRLGNVDPAGEFGPTPDAGRDLVLEVTRGMPYNPTTEMDLALWEMAKTIRRDPVSRQVIQDHPAVELSARYHAGKLTPLIIRVVGQFLELYGGRGLGEIDLGRSRWGEDPTYVFEMLGSFLRIEDEARAPDVVFSRGAEVAQKAVAQLEAAVRKAPHGWFKAPLVRFFAGRARQLMGTRESPKFFAVRMFWLVRRELLKTGMEFVQAGDLEQPDDLIYLTFSELHAFSAREEKDWRSLIDGRRRVYQQEYLRRQIPRLLVSDGRAFYAGLQTGESVAGGLAGSPVSPGSVEGRVRVVINPLQAGLLPGEILVCPGTDPTWTPLFLYAAGLVMEVGGMMTHGAVVAREYGIPAIVGVDLATTRLQTGQLIRIDGSTGQIVNLENQPEVERSE